MTRSLSAALAVASVVCILVPALARAQTPSGVGSKAEQERTLIAVLRSDAALHERAQACQQLAVIGTAESVPALAALLSDRELGSYARSALEAIAAPSAGDALRRAMGQLQGRSLIGVLNSVGVRRDAKAVPALVRLTSHRDTETAGASLAALGRIATPDALKALERSLAVGPAVLRPLAADACITAADRLLALGRRREAIALYDRVGKAAVPKHVRLAALHRSIAARGTSGVPTLVAQLRSSDSDAVAMALRAVRDLPGEGVTRALTAELPKARPSVQVLLIPALVEHGGPGVLPGIEAAAGTGPAETRIEALRALGEIGGASSIPILLRAVETARSDAETTTATASLTRLNAEGTEAAILKTLPAQPATVQARLLAILAGRNATTAADAALKLAGEPDVVVSKAAFGALVTLGRPGDLSEIVRRMARCSDESVREDAGRAALATAAKLPNVNGRSDPIAAALRETKEPAIRRDLLGLLGEIGTYPACVVVRSALDDPDRTVRLAAIRSLADWPDPTPTEVLLNVARDAIDPSERSIALRGAIRMAGALAAEGSRTSPQATGWLARANQAVRGDADEKRLILSALGSLRNAEGLAMVQSYLADPQVSSEAALAVIRIARQIPGEHQDSARSMLEKVIAAPPNEEVRRQAEEALAQLSSRSADPPVPTQADGEVDVTKLVFRPLFDGRSFEGWEGDTEKSFRIEDGAIVGGSLKSPVPQNEFLCTTRSYANFVLRAECWLTSANAGIQIRSLRVPRSAEVCGYQADMDSSGTYWGCLYDESRRGMLVQADPAKIAEVVKRDGWNAYEIRCEGPRIRLYVNGTLTVDYIEKDPAILQSGVIALQVHGGPPSEAWYRNIMIAELP